MSRFRPYTSLRGQRAAFNTLQAWLVRCSHWHHGSSAIASVCRYPVTAKKGSSNR
jgi:hypothetical protein